MVVMKWYHLRVGVPRHKGPLQDSNVFFLALTRLELDQKAQVRELSDCTTTGTVVKSGNEEHKKKDKMNTKQRQR